MPKWLDDAHQWANATEEQYKKLASQLADKDAEIATLKADLESALSIAEKCVPVVKYGKGTKDTDTAQKREALLKKYGRVLERNNYGVVLEPPEGE